MTQATQSVTHIEGSEERKALEVQRTRRFLLFFKTKWWETISERHIGNDIHIKTTNEIRSIYLNGKEINVAPTPLE